jgi:hypothetical protein
MKDSEIYTLYIAFPFIDRNIDNYGNYSGDSMKEYNDYVDHVRKESKKICSTCKRIFDEIFKLRRQNLSLLSDDIWNISYLPCKDIKNEKKSKQKDEENKKD